MTTELPGLIRIERPSPDSPAVLVARSLLDYLVSGGIKVGQRLPAERDLAEAFGVGRSAVREALKSLNLLGLVEIRQGDGTYLKRPESTLLPQVLEWGLLLGERQTLELVEARQGIEVMSARLAALRQDDELLRDLAEILERMRLSQQSPQEFIEADVAFHLRLAKGAQNQVVYDMLSSLSSLLGVWVQRAVHATEELSGTYREHEVVYEAVSAGDPAAAAEAMTAHMISAADRLEGTIGATEGASDAE